jgi:hypothetical protein
MFLERFETVIAEAELDPSQTAFGADPRLGSLVQEFLARRQNWPRESRLYDMPLHEVRRLLQSENVADRALLGECLKELRELLEEHVRADAEGLLGNI